MKQNKILSEITDLPNIDSKVYKDFQYEISNTTAKTVICSEENLFSIPAEKMQIISNFLSNFFAEIEIIVYLRRQDDHFLSIYQQNVRGKTTETIKEVLNSESYKNKYFYNTILSTWRSNLKNASITIRPYGQLINKDIVDDFYALLKIQKDTENIEANLAVKNKSFDAESIELIRLFNLLEANDKLILPHHRKRELRMFLKNKIRNDKFSLIIHDKKKIWSAFLEDNQQLCSNFNLEESKAYFLSEPTIDNSKPLYNQHIEKDHLYNLFFDVFEK